MIIFSKLLHCRGITGMKMKKHVKSIVNRFYPRMATGTKLFFRTVNGTAIKKSLRVLKLLGTRQPTSGRNCRLNKLIKVPNSRIIPSPCPWPPPRKRNEN